MGKKNRKKQDDGDYFASLGAPTENSVDDAAAERAEDERLARQARAAAQREAKKQKEAQDRAERAAVAERARLAMERRNNKGKSVVVEEEEEEAVEEPAPAPAEAEAEAAPPPPPLSAFARVLLFLRPFSPVHKSNCRGTSPPLLNHDLHAIDATPARWLIYAQVLARRRRREWSR
jgi:fructose-specific component phosphotransferase system IIB-like protein